MVDGLAAVKEARGANTLCSMLRSMLGVQKRFRMFISKYAVSIGVSVLVWCAHTPASLLLLYTNWSTVLGAVQGSAF